MRQCSGTTKFAKVSKSSRSVWLTWNLRINLRSKLVHRKRDGMMHLHGKPTMDGSARVIKSSLKTGMDAYENLHRSINARGARLVKQTYGSNGVIFYPQL